MSLASIKRRITLSGGKHRRTTSSESAGSDQSLSSSSDSLTSSPPIHSYIPTSRRAHLKTISISGPLELMPSMPPHMPPMPVLAGSTSTLSRSSSTIARGDAPPRPPRFSRPRAAPIPSPAGSSAAVSVAAGGIEHAPPSRPSLTSPPVPRRAMPPWRASLIGLAESYAPLGASPSSSSAGYTFLMSRLHDSTLSERQALAALRCYVDTLHASTRRPSFTSDVSDSDSDYVCL